MKLRAVFLGTVLLVPTAPSISGAVEAGWWGPPAFTDGFAYAYGYPGYGLGYSRYRYGFGPMYVLGSRCGLVPYRGFTSYRHCGYRR